MPIYEYQCKACGHISEILVRTLNESQTLHCQRCDDTDLVRLVSRPGLIRTQGRAEPGELRPVDPRQAVEGMRRMYDQTGIDPGQGFREVAQRTAAGDSPDTLKEMIQEVKQKEATNSNSTSKSSK